MFQYIKIGKISECPYCNKKLNKIPKRKSKCIFCNKYIFVRTRPLDKKKVLIKEVELNIIDREWFKYNQEKEYNQLLNDPEFLLSKKELVREFKKEPSLNDIKWRLYSKKDLEYISKKEYENLFLKLDKLMAKLFSFMRNIESRFENNKKFFTNYKE